MQFAEHIKITNNHQFCYLTLRQLESHLVVEVLSERWWLVAQLSHHRRRVSVSLTVRCSSPQHNLVQTSLEILTLLLQGLYCGGQAGQHRDILVFTSLVPGQLLTFESSLYPGWCPRTASGCASQCPPWRPPTVRRLSSDFHSCPGGPRLALLNTERDKISDLVTDISHQAEQGWEA